MKQREIPLMGPMKAPVDAPWVLVERCRDELDAIHLCIQLRQVRYSNTILAEKLGIDKGHFTRILTGEAHFPTRKRRLLMELCGNKAPYQFEQLWAGDAPKTELEKLRATG